MEDITIRAHKAINHGIIEAHKTEDLCYYGNLNALISDVYELLFIKNEQQLINAIEELETLSKSKMHYGEIIV